MTNNINMPALRFSEFEGEWEIVKFGDIFSFKRTNSFSRSLLNYKKGTVKNIHYGDIHTKFNTNFDITKENVPFVNENVSFKNITEDDYVKVGDLVIADASEDYKDIGKAIEIRNIDNQKLISGLHTYIARDEGNRMALGFNGYFMQTQNMRFQIMRIATGTSVLGVSKTNLVKLKFPIPTKPEQQKIANFLTAIDKKIQQLRQKHALLTDYKKGIMQQIFKQDIRFRKDDGGDFEDWEEVILSEICKNVGGTPLEKYVSDDGKHNFISIGNYSKNGHYINNGQKVLLTNKTKTKLLDEGDIVMVLNDKTKSGDIIGSSILINESNKFIYNQRSERLIFNDEINRKFIWFLLNSKSFRKKVFSISQGGTQIYVNFSAVKKLKLNLPSLPEQQKIANFLSSIDGKIGQVEEQIEEMEGFKKGLLQRMFV